MEKTCTLYLMFHGGAPSYFQPAFGSPYIRLLVKFASPRARWIWRLVSVLSLSLSLPLSRSLSRSSSSRCLSHPTSLPTFSLSFLFIFLSTVAFILSGHPQFVDPLSRLPPPPTAQHSHHYPPTIKDHYPPIFIPVTVALRLLPGPELRKHPRGRLLDLYYSYKKRASSTNLYYKQTTSSSPELQERGLVVLQRNRFLIQIFGGLREAFSKSLHYKEQISKRRFFGRGPKGGRSEFPGPELREVFSHTKLCDKERVSRKRPRDVSAYYRTTITEFLPPHSSRRPPRSVFAYSIFVLQASERRFCVKTAPCPTNAYMIHHYPFFTIPHHTRHHPPLSTITHHSIHSTPPFHI